MKCPACESSERGIVSTRMLDTKVLRLRSCSACGHRWRTVEIGMDRLLLMESAVTTVKALSNLAKEMENAAPTHS